MNINRGTKRTLYFAASAVVAVALIVFGLSLVGMYQLDKPSFKATLAVVGGGMTCALFLLHRKAQLSEGVVGHAASLASITTVFFTWVIADRVSDMATAGITPLGLIACALAPVLCAAVLGAVAYGLGALSLHLQAGFSNRP